MISWNRAAVRMESTRSQLSCSASFLRARRAAAAQSLTPRLEPLLSFGLSRLGRHLLNFVFNCGRSFSDHTRWHNIRGARRCRDYERWKGRVPALDLPSDQAPAPTDPHNCAADREKKQRYDYRCKFHLSTRWSRGICSRCRSLSSM